MAQLSIYPNPATNDNVQFDEFEGVAYADITNEFDHDLELTWVRSVIEMTEGWESAVCDVNQCYMPFVNSQDFFLEAGHSGDMDVHVYPNGIEGGAIVKVEVFVTEDPSISTSALYYFNHAVGLTERFTEKVKLFPNPTSDFIHIEDSKNDINGVEVFSIDGKLLLSTSLSIPQSIDIRNLPKGNYILKLRNKNAQVVSTNLIIKI